ncbi:UDP-N-acetylglucosamine 2-epimerase [Pontibacterium granulatum]|uniref:UDP-N-acetylglucosamine 2-epimerase n=1 Tax=Pontibacterium granulatum TaxID=2036029 RepID=UPI00249AC38A|nr:UDP-N-acetylglucosamine 2-epimerase [Pontibacterium granulatum]MDI3323043.1 UDP-N-acetylglucosamine 2-epimerase [Pontibacterium granulatum]
MKKVCVFTSTRAEYGLLYWLIKAIDESHDFELQLVVTGTHLSHEYGYTVEDIVADGFEPTIRIPMLISDDSPVALTRSSALLSISLAEFFDRERPDCFVVLGDRIELMAACEAATIAKIPIVHIHGGEITEGAVDEKVRHAVSKLANLHFTSTDAYRRRVIQMGETPESVVNCGALGLESLSRKELPTLEELCQQLNMELKSGYFLIVYHPETNKDSENISDLLKACDDYPEYKKVIIYPNSDMMSREIIKQIEAYGAQSQDSVELIRSTERDNYLGLMKYCEMFIGNSSSGVIEMPSFHRPIINIGDRQKGRIKSESTVDVEMEYIALKSAIDKGLSESFQFKISTMKNPYQGDLPSQTILDGLRAFCDGARVEKKFMDLEFDL